MNHEDDETDCKENPVEPVGRRGPREGDIQEEGHNDGDMRNGDDDVSVHYYNMINIILKGNIAENIRRMHILIYFTTIAFIEYLSLSLILKDTEYVNI